MPASPAAAVAAQPEVLVAAIFKDRAAVLSAQPAEFVCADCNVSQFSLERELPLGWDACQSEGGVAVRCPDCLEAIERRYRPSSDPRPRPVHEAVPEETPFPLVVDERGWATIPDPLNDTACSWRNYRGCRIMHWPMPEFDGVAIQFIGATAPVEGEVVPDSVLMTLSLSGIDEMIRHLQAVKDDLTERVADRLISRGGANV